MIPDSREILEERERNQQMAPLKEALLKDIEDLTGGPDVRASARIEVLQAGRCKLVKTTSSIYISYAGHDLVYHRLKLTGPYLGDIDTKWIESSKATTATGFLDLPREIRDMIYCAICDQLPHLGIHWIESDRTRVQSLPMLPLLKYLRNPENRTELVSDLTIMQSCRQIHSEFAEILYSEPLELQLNLTQSTSLIAFPAAYTNLVRTVFVTVMLPDQNPPEKCWVYTVQVANSVAKIFPALRTLRVGWCPGSQVSSDRVIISSSPYESAAWDIFAGRTEGDWESRVKRVARLLRKYCRKMGFTPTVPHQVELVQLNFNGPDFHTPLVEAALNLRRKPPKAKSQLRKRAAAKTYGRKYSKNANRHP